MYDKSEKMKTFLVELTKLFSQDLLLEVETSMTTSEKAKNVCKNVKNHHVLNWTYGLFGKNYRVATLSTFSLTVSGIIIPSLKVIGQF